MVLVIQTKQMSNGRLAGAVGQILKVKVFLLLDMYCTMYTQFNHLGVIGVPQ